MIKTNNNNKDSQNLKTKERNIKGNCVSQSANVDVQIYIQ